jgi:hypothetical protein
LIERELPMHRRLASRVPHCVCHSVLAAGLTLVACAEARAGDAGSGGLSGAVPLLLGGVIMVGIVAAGWLVLGARLSGAGRPTAVDSPPDAAGSAAASTGGGPLAQGPWAEPPDLRRAPNPFRHLAVPIILVIVLLAGGIPSLIYVVQLWNGASKFQQDLKAQPMPLMPAPQFDWNKQLYQPMYSPPQNDLPIVITPTPPTPGGR